MPEAETQETNEQDRAKLVEVDDLLLDPKNPRLASNDLEDPTQEDLVKILWQQMAVDELLLSIAANGYFPEERLFVIPSDESEGNWRLAAVKLLRDEGLRQDVGATGPEIEEAIREGGNWNASIDL